MLPYSIPPPARVECSPRGGRLRLPSPLYSGTSGRNSIARRPVAIALAKSFRKKDFPQIAMILRDIPVDRNRLPNQHRRRRWLAQLELRQPKQEQACAVAPAEFPVPVDTARKPRQAFLPRDGPVPARSCRRTTATSLGSPHRVNASIFLISSSLNARFFSDATFSSTC